MFNTEETPMTPLDYETYQRDARVAYDQIEDLLGELIDLEGLHEGGVVGGAINALARLLERSHGFDEAMRMFTGLVASIAEAGPRYATAHATPANDPVS
ncbi:MAG: hypothetical protein ACRYG4_09205 [Janthinobacterium lividum]